MKVTPINDVLLPAGFTVPTFSALVPDVANYKAMLFQPCGDIDADVTGVRNRDRALATSQFKRFLAEAARLNADLAVTPEYSMPWNVLMENLAAGTVPAEGQLWALGCESISYADLEALAAAQAGKIKFLYEPLQPENGKFVDPLAYVFCPAATDAAKPEKLIIVVQFKTHPMGDKDHYEVTNLQRGTKIYQLGEKGRLRLLSLICSDAFAFADEHAKEIYDRTLILHLQLNPHPRHPQYRLYRDKLLGFSGDATELICLNWAGEVSCWSDNKPSQWKNIAGSAWYLRPDKFDSREETLLKNHRRGLYYTYLKPLQYHALFFNYKPAVFMLEASKVVHLNVQGALSQRRGPQLQATLIWDSVDKLWVEQGGAEDGFASIAQESGNAKAEIDRLLAANPLHVERLLALSAGEIGLRNDWHDVRELDSCLIDASEIVYRLTFCQDTDEKAAKFRIGRLMLYKRLMSLLRGDKLPPAIADFAEGFELSWSPDAPHQNATSAAGARATVVYMGEQISRAAVESTKARIVELLNRSIIDPDERSTAKQRLIVWYQDGAEPTVLNPHEYMRIDKADSASAFDVGREN